MSHGDVAINVKVAMDVGTKLIEAGFAVFIPHLFHFMHLYNPQEYERWLAMDFAVIRKCDGLLRIPGYSPGADREVVFATDHGIPVFYGIAELVKHFSKVALCLV
jgi:hypothetical protein